MSVNPMAPQAMGSWNNYGTQPSAATSAQNGTSEVSERDVRVMKRKQVSLAAAGGRGERLYQAGSFATLISSPPRLQANRDSARRSKQKKKQEFEDLGSKRAELTETNRVLIARVDEATERVRALQETNVKLQQQYQSLKQA
jgi:hypothetical protein